MLFGTYPAERASRIEGALRGAITVHSGQRLPDAGTYRIWGSRFYPTDPSRETPSPGAVLVPQEGLPQVLRQTQAHLDVALQGSISRGGEALLLAFGGDGEGSLQDLAPSGRRALLRIAREQGGDEYRDG